MPGKKHTALLGLGSNLDDRAALLSSALRALDAVPAIRLAAASAFVQTAPVGKTDQPDFLNCAAEIHTSLPPRKLLDACMAIEASLGRKRAERWGPRTIDIDILLYDDLVVDDPELTIPHPRMHERYFVLGPLAQIAPDARHPLLGQTVSELFRDLPDEARR